MTYYLQWVRLNDVERRLAQGWSIAQSSWCHHNEYAVLMQIPNPPEPA